MKEQGAAEEEDREVGSKRVVGSALGEMWLPQTSLAG